jgi:hypothetical protein
MPHFPYYKIARAIVKNWGSESPDKDAAVQKVISKGIGVSDVCLVEIVRAMRAFGKAFSAERDYEEDDVKSGERPRWAMPFPDAKVGDVLYHCDGIELEQGVTQSVVVDVLEGGHVRVLHCVFPPGNNGLVQLSWGSEGMFPTEAEALLHKALEDARYHGKHLALAKRIIKAVKTGGDLK